MKTSTRLFLRPLAVVSAMAAPLLGGCSTATVLHPVGDVAARQRDMLLTATGLMLLVIVPVMVLTVIFAWRYRAGRGAKYQPDWDHSIHLELVIWSAPLLIVICLGALTWLGTHLLDPYRPLDRFGIGEPVAAEAQALEIDVVALDWKWLFIYPEYGVASVNELAVPVGRPVHFRITSSTVMNAFYVPTLAGQIYAMSGMETQLHGIVDRPVESIGFSSNYSGAGFSGMRFAFHGMPKGVFDEWLTELRAAPEKLDRAAYRNLEKPSQNVVPKYYANVDPALFRAIVNLCVDEGSRCVDDTMMLDAQGGAGKASARDIAGLHYDRDGRRGGQVHGLTEP